MATLATMEGPVNMTTEPRHCGKVVAGSVISIVVFADSTGGESDA